MSKTKSDITLITLITVCMRVYPKPKLIQMQKTLESLAYDKHVKNSYILLGGVISVISVINSGGFSMNIKIKEEYTKLVPPLTEPDNNALKESIQNHNGNCYPIILNNDGFILDGHHRFSACQELDIKPNTEVKKFMSSRRYMIQNDFKLIKYSLKYNKISNKKNFTLVYVGICGRILILYQLVESVYFMYCMK